MDFDQVVQQKSRLILRMNDAQNRNERREMRNFGSTAASLESLVADVYLKNQDYRNAVISLVSAASCMKIAGRPREAIRLFRLALEHSREARAKAWISQEIATFGEAEVRVEPFSQPVNIEQNSLLRRPQVSAYMAARSHFATSSEHAIIQLPVGCGKTGTMALLPFNISRGRVLVVAPNVEIGQHLCRNFDISAPENFWSKTKVLNNGSGPHCAELRGDANVIDCDNSDFVVTNIQQLVSTDNQKWLAKFPIDYFDMLFFDEGHHNTAASWQSVLEHFPNAKAVSFTATPLRSDGKKVEGKRIYRFPIADAIREGYVKDIASRRLEPSEIYFTYMGEEHRHSLEEVCKLREETWFSRGVALSPECNRNIVDASIKCMYELREEGTEHHQIIAVACSIDHAKAIRSLYSERNLKAEVLFSKMSSEEQEDTRRRLRTRDLDVIVQVAMLGEGADYPALSVAAIFRPFRHLVPYVQFVGRIMRVLKEQQPSDPDNRGYVVSHYGLNIDRWWEELHLLDEGDQEFFEDLANGCREFSGTSVTGAPDGTQRRRRFAPDMQVLKEHIEYYVQTRFLPEDSAAMVEDLLRTMRLRGIDPDILGVSKEELAERLLEAQRAGEARGKHEPLPVQPQKARQEARRRLDERVRSGAKELLNALGYSVAGFDLPRKFPGTSATNNLAAAIILLNQSVQQLVGAGKSERDLLTQEQCQRAHDSMDQLIDDLVNRIRGS